MNIPLVVLPYQHPAGKSTSAYTKQHFTNVQKTDAALTLFIYKYKFIYIYWVSELHIEPYTVSNTAFLKDVILQRFVYREQSFSRQVSRPKQSIFDIHVG